MDKWKEETERLVKRSYRDQSLDSGHREKLRKQMLAAYDRSRSVRRPFTSVFLYLKSFWRWVMTRPIPRLGVPVGVAVLLLLGVMSFFPAKSSWAVEDFLKPLMNAKTMRCKMVVNTKDKPAFTFRAMFRGTVGRQESVEMGSINIHDDATGNILTLIPQQKKAVLLEAVNRDPDLAGSGGFLQSVREQILNLKQNERGTRVSLGERELAEQHLVGFRITSSAMRMDIWGDSKTGLPHSIVTNMASLPNAEVTMTEFEFDVELDDALFSLVPPAGYTVTKNITDLSKPKEEDLIAALRQFTDLNDGAFPDSINMEVALTVLGKLQATFKSDEDKSKEISRVVGLLTRGFMFPLTLPVESNAVYAGKDATRQDANQPIFWYQSPEGKGVIRVIHADLSVVETDQVPQADGVQRFEPVQ